MPLFENDIQQLEGPFSHHLYIGFSKNDVKDVFRLRTQLEKRKVSCCLRSFKDEIKTSIRDGVRKSQKCLIFLSSDYLDDDWYTIEVEALLEKVAQFCRDSLIIMKKSESSVIPEKLCGFRHILFHPDKLDDEKANAKLVDIITSEPNVQLTVLPKQNIGYGAALGYFYGFLRLTLPDFKERLIKETLLNEPNLMAKAVKKMLIIMPESCFCPVKMVSPGEIEFTEKFLVRAACRAGNIRRDYKSSLFRIKDKVENEDYYFVGELATPLLTMFEMHYFDLCGLTKDQLYAERDAFYFTLKAILSHPENEECNNQFRLLYWSDPETGFTDDKNRLNRQSLYQFLLPVVKEELRLERENERHPSKIGTPISRRLRSPSRQLSSFEPVEVSGPNPARIYEEVEQYPMKKIQRGICLIINIINFDKGHVHLKPRRGSENDTKVLQRLFEDLHFKVAVHTDLNASTLENLFLTTHLIDHSDYDAFVCCILTHGKLGVVYTSDGKAVEILSLVDFFSDRQCPSLKGKPKLFFIQACQRGYAEPSEETGHSLPRDGTAGSRTESDDVQGGMTGLRLDEDALRAPKIATSAEESVTATFKHKSVLVPGSPDFLMSYSTLPGSISYRDTETGSLYVQELNDCLRKGQEIDRALKQVSKQVRKSLEEKGEEDMFQLPFHLTSGMDRLIFF